MTLLNQLNNNQATEPAVKVGTFTGTVAGLISLILYFAPNLLNDKQLGIIAIIGAFLLPFVTALFTRGKVWSPAAVKAVVDEAVAKALDEISNQKRPAVTTTDKSIEDTKLRLATPSPTSGPNVVNFEDEWPPK